MNTRKIFKKMILKRRKRHLTWLRQFHCSIKDLLYHPAVQQMKDYLHHGRTNCYDHCRHVAYFNYKWCRALNLGLRDPRPELECFTIFFSTTGILMGKKTGEKLHGLTHPAAAFENARKYFKLKSYGKRYYSEPHVAGDAFFIFPGPERDGLLPISR